MTPTETILVFTALVELCLILLLLWRDSNKPVRKSHVVRNRKYPRCQRNSQGTWVID